MPFFVDESYTSKKEDDVLLDEEFDMDSYLETCLYMDLMSKPADERKAIAESEEAAVLEAKGLVGRKTFIRLSKVNCLFSSSKLTVKLSKSLLKFNISSCDTFRRYKSNVIVEIEV